MGNNDQLLHEKFVIYGANVKGWMRQCVMLLPDIKKHQIWKKKGFSSLKKLGLKLTLEYQGIVIEEVTPKSAAEEAGLKEQDLLTQVDGFSTRYMPLKKVVRLIEDFPGEGPVAFTVRRFTHLSRK